MDNSKIFKPDILIVSSMPETIFHLKEVMGAIDVGVTPAMSGKEAVEKARTDAFALVIIDLPLPETTGFKTASLIQKHEKNKNVPNLFLSTAFDETDYKHEALKTGKIDFLVKPVTKEMLTGKVNVFLERYKQKMELEHVLERAKCLTREAEAGSVVKSEFLANMSHELRTPLNSILILSKLLADNKHHNLTKDQIRFSKIINSSGNDLLRLINEILDLAKVEAGKIELFAEEVNLKQIESQLNDVFENIAKDKKIIFGIEIDEELPDSIITDWHRLIQIIQNLLSNAFKFTEKGTVTLTISKPNQEVYLRNDNLDIHEAIAFTVKDTGIGVPKDKRKHIFKAFQQAQGSISRKYGGTGLGLSISKEFANLFGGEIQIQSEEGKGSTFTLIIPRQMKPGRTGNVYIRNANEMLKSKDGSGDAAKPKTKHQLTDNIAIADDLRAKLKHKKILIVDDDMRNVFALTKVLEERKVCVIIGSDGNKGLTRLKENPDVNLVIMDMMMPVMDGYRAMKKIRSQKQYKDLPIIAVTAKAMKGDKKKCLEAGASSYMAKPVNIGELLTMVGSWLP